MRADADLPWYYGSASRTAAGDLGQRSTLGSQLDAARASRVNVEPSTLRRPGRPWSTEVDRTPEGDRIHCQPSPHSVNASQVEDGAHQALWSAGRVAEIEARLATLTTVQQQVLRLHYSGTSLPYGVDPCARLLFAARAMCNCGGEASEHGPAAEVLRAALHRASEGDRKRLSEAADGLVRAAIEAYEGAEVQRMRPVQVNDPRGRR